MNQETLKIFAQVKLAARKAGFDVDLAKLVADKDYAHVALDKLIASGVADVVTYAKQAKATLTITTPVVPTPVQVVKEVATPEAPKPAEKPDKKYVMGVRG
jgi:hypothetical protein